MTLQAMHGTCDLHHNPACSYLNAMKIQERDKGNMFEKSIEVNPQEALCACVAFPGWRASSPIARI